MHAFRFASALALVALLSPLAAAQEPTLSVSTSTPALCGSIARGAQRIPLLTVTFAASCQKPVTVTSLRLRHGGLAPAADLLRIYALEGYARVSRPASVSAMLPATIRFPALVIPACGKRTVTIAADLSTTASVQGWHTLSLTGVTGNAQVTIGE